MQLKQIYEPNLSQDKTLTEVAGVLPFPYQHRLPPARLSYECINRLQILKYEIYEHRVQYREAKMIIRMIREAARFQYGEE